MLDLLIEALADYPTVTGLHAEVYADPRGDADPTAGGLAPIAEAYALPFEPTLFLADADGHDHGPPGQRLRPRRAPRGAGPDRLSGLSGIS